MASFFDPDGVIRRLGLGRQCNDVDQMQAALEQLLDRPAELAEIGGRGYEFASGEFSSRQVAARYLELLAGDAAERAGRRAVG